MSDLSLADSRGTGIAQSPGIFSNAQLSDFFTRMKPERPHLMALQTQGSTPKILTPKSDIPDDENIKVPPGLRKQRTSSLKHFFRSNKYKGSQKSLLDPVIQDQFGSKRNLPYENEEVCTKLCAY